MMHDKISFRDIMVDFNHYANSMGLEMQRTYCFL